MIKMQMEPGTKESGSKMYDGDGEWSTDVDYNVLQYQWKIEIAYENLRVCH